MSEENLHRFTLYLSDKELGDIRALTKYNLKTLARYPYFEKDTAKHLLLHALKGFKREIMICKIILRLGKKYKHPFGLKHRYKDSLWLLPGGIPYRKMFLALERCRHAYGY